jgi:hypothetical protein
MKIKKNLAISDTGFVFDPTTGDSYTLNSTGLEIIQLMKEGKSIEEVIRQMTATYDVDTNTFERYFYDFAGMLKQMQLVAPDEES